MAVPISGSDMTIGTAHSNAEQVHIHGTFSYLPEVFAPCADRQ
jgi:hypothetical protein